MSLDILPPRPTGALQTSSGAFFNVFEPRIEDVSLFDIARALSNLTRFGGHVPRFYSVAQHSVLVSRLVPAELAREGLLHDAAEAYVLDMPRPIKHHPSFKLYREIEDSVERVIATKFGLQYPFPAEVKKADNKALAIEALKLKHAQGNPYWEPWLTEFADEHQELLEAPLIPLQPDSAFELFSERCRDLGLYLPE